MDYDILIVGGGPAGLSAAINGRVRGKTVLLLSSPMEDSPLWKAERVENYLGLPGVTGAELLTAFRPTLLFVEHDRIFCDKIATKLVEL